MRPVRRLFILVLILVGWFPFLVIPNANADASVQTKTITFDDLSPGVEVNSYYYEKLGCNFSGAVVYKADTAWLAHSLPNLVMSQLGNRAIRVDFDPAMKVFLVGAWFTTGASDAKVNLYAYDANGNIVGQTLDVSSGYDGLNPGPPVNAHVTCNETESISYVVFSDTGALWGMDDFNFTFEWAFDFSISVSPTSGTIQQGSSGTATVSVTLLSGKSHRVRLGASDQPSGVGIDFNPTSGNPPFSSTMNISVGSSTATGTYTITITGSHGAETHTCAYTLTVSAVPFDFSISVNPASSTIEQGTSGTVSVTVSLLSGSSQSVSLSLTGLPGSCTYSFSQSSGTPTYSSTLTLNIDSSATTGTYSLTITGTVGELTRTTSLSLTVTSGFDFTIGVSPDSLSIQQGSSGTATVSITLTSGSTPTVSLSLSSQPSDVTVSFSPSSGTPSYSSNMSIAVGSSVTEGPYDITITGSGGGKTQSCTYTLSVTAVDTVPPEAVISFNPDTRKIVVKGVDDSGRPVAVKSEVVSHEEDDCRLHVHGDGSSKHANVTRYVLTDAAGNSMNITIRSVSSSGFASIEVIQVSYNKGDSIKPPRNMFMVMYGLDRKTGKLKLIAELIYVKGEFGVEALYNAKTDKTWIFIHQGREEARMISKPGLFLLTLVTDRGSLTCPEAV